MSVIELMSEFAERGRRYLWTDAFAVCNYLGLGKRDLAVELVDRVHHTLGRHRPDDVRRGWISGLSEAEGEAHPTRGGLRIGKPLPERSTDEWDRDGQYFHYLTKWMHALAQVAIATGEPRYAEWARELADAAYHAFVLPDHRAMVWKRSIDLSRVQVASMGHHDPLDGYVTYLELEATAQRLSARGPVLDEAIATFRALIRDRELATGDPLGIGGLLFDASRLAQLGVDPSLKDALLVAADRGLRHYLAQPDLFVGPEQRLAFRELGLAIGIAAAGIERYAPVRSAIEAFWIDPAHRAVATYREHEDINDVMLATALAPSGFTVLGVAAQPLHERAPADWFARCST